MAGFESQQSPEECVNQGFDLLAEKEQGFPEFDEALKNKLLDEAAKSFSEAGMTPQQITNTISMWFPNDQKNHYFSSIEAEGITTLGILSKYGDYYKGVDLQKVADAIQGIYDGYAKGMDKYVIEYSQIEENAHQGAIDCHLDVNREILQDYQRRIREYCEEQEISKMFANKWIEIMEKSKIEIYSGEYEFVLENFDDIKTIMPSHISDTARGISRLNDEQLKYLSGLSIALIRASLDDVESKKESMK